LNFQKNHTMNNTFTYNTLTSLTLLAATFVAAAETYVPRDSNSGNTGWYDATKIEARMNIEVNDATEVIHFIRDNNDPRVVTKTYLLENVDPYQFRDYLRQMVQSKRVGNASLQQQYPSNTASAPYVATESSPVLASPNAQPGYAPATQLGSNTAVECLKYVDGTGLLIVSAEEYRFKDSENGIGIDTLVATLDDPDLGDLNFGTQMFIYMPAFVPARNLMPLVENVGMNTSDVTELWQGQDLVAYDPDLNWLIFDVCNYSCANVSAMLRKFDVPIPQVRLNIRVYEITAENDDKLGIDFQNWKNNEGADLFSVGGRYRNNWQALYSNGVMPAKNYGSERTSYFNFNPKWNTRYLDFLESNGSAKVIHSGELLIRNNSPASWECTTRMIYVDSSQPVPGTTTDEDPYQVGAYRLLSEVVNHALAAADAPPKNADMPVAKGNAQVSTVSSTEFGFTLTVHNVSVNLDETLFDITVDNTSLLGFQSNGSPRISAGSPVTQRVSLPHGYDSFVIGGLSKQEEVVSRTGVPWLMDIPILGYLFSSESTSLKNSRLIVVGQCVLDTPSPASPPHPNVP